jgi:hypothetical protein
VRQPRTEVLEEATLAEDEDPERGDARTHAVESVKRTALAQQRHVPAAAAPEQEDRRGDGHDDQGIERDGGFHGFRSMVAARVVAPSG